MSAVYQLRRTGGAYKKRTTILLSTIFKTKPGFWKWKLSLPSKRPIISWIAVSSDKRPVSHYAYLPLDIIAGSERVRGALCTAMATDPKHRGRSLITQLSQFALQDTEKQGTEICLGFSNPLGLKVDKRSVGYGYRIVGAFATYAAVPARSQNEGVTLTAMKPREKFRSFPASAHGLGIEKSARYLHWRYCAQPDNKNHRFRIHHKNKQIGYAILRITEARIEILDLIVEKDEDILAGLRGCLLFSKNKSKIVTVSVLKNTFWKRALSQAGFYPLPKPAHYHLTIKSTRHTPSNLRRLFSQPNSWRLMGGDIL